ncbi:diacylglycerol/lipid kinase family protein [Rhodobacteraceae bacterium nBUS_22]
MKQGDRYLFLINPKSGKMRLKAKQQLIAEIADPNKSQVLVASSPEHSGSAAKDAMLKGEIVVSCGGDGLQNIVAQQAVETGGLMTVLPLGRGNDFASSLKINNAKDTVLALKNGIIHHARYASVEFSNHSRITLTCAGVGLLSEAAFRASKIPFLHGRILYTLASLLCFINLKCHSYQLNTDGKKTRQENLIIAGAATEYTGGGIFIAPLARQEPDLLNVLSASSVTRLSAVNLLNRAISGKHLSHPKVTNSYFAQCEIDNLSKDSWSKLVYGDGEFLGELPVKLTLGKRPLRVLTPTNI